MSTSAELSGFDHYRKTRSMIFGNATHSQLKYLNASIELQQTLLTSCDGIVSNQLKWIENYTKQNKDSRLPIDGFLKGYTSVINLYMNYVSHYYDFATTNITLFTKGVEALNDYFMGLTRNRAEMEGLPLSEGS
jgi:hypothetical protein